MTCAARRGAASQSAPTLAIQSIAGAERRRASARSSVSRPSRRLSTSPASFSAARCFATACRVTGSSAASSVAVAVSRSRKRLERRSGGSGRRARRRRAPSGRSRVQRREPAPGARVRSRTAASTRARAARVPPRPPPSVSSTAPSSSQSSTQPLAGRRLDDRGAALLAVVPAEDAVAALARVELDVVREPLLELLGIRQRLPDLVGRRRRSTISRVDLHDRLQSAQPVGCV